VQGSLPELSTQKVVNKHQKAKENIDKKKISNKQYYDAKKNTKTSKIKKGDIVICKQKQNSIPSDLQSWRGKAQQLRHEMADAPAITRNVTHFKVVKPVDEQSSDEEKSTTLEDVQDNRVGDDMQDFIGESHPIARRSTRNQRPVNRFCHSIPLGLIS
jgi:hypothetical protein